MTQIETMVATHTKKSIPLHDPDDCYTATDMSSTYITLNKGPPENTQEIYHYHGCYGDEGIEKLSRLVYDIKAKLPLKELGLDEYEEFKLPSYEKSSLGYRINF